MKVILLKDVAKIGRKGATVVVPDGFALNKLIPNGMAQTATPENIKRLEHLSSKLAQTMEVEAGEFSVLLEALKEKKVEIVVEANTEGRMFQALKVEAIKDAIKTCTNIVVGTEHITLTTPIKSVGDHEIVLHAGKTQGTAVITLIAKSK